MKNNLLTPVTLFCLILFLCTSCVWRHVTPSHNTPHFTDKGQFEFGCNGGITGANANFAYSPVKYLSLQANGCSSIISKNSFNSQMEMGIGAYLPIKAWVMGLTAGYGVGTTSWTRWWYSSGNDFKFLKFDTKKYYLDYYVSFKQINIPAYWGLSAKVSFLNDFYRHSYTDDHYVEKRNYANPGTGVELTGFFKRLISRRCFFNLNYGIGYYRATHAYEHTRFYLLRAGFCYEF